MDDVMVDENGDLRCPACGNKNLVPQATLKTQLVLGTRSLEGFKKLKCLACNKFCQGGRPRPYELVSETPSFTPMVGSGEPIHTGTVGRPIEARAGTHISFEQAAPPTAFDDPPPSPAQQLEEWGVVYRSVLVRPTRVLVELLAGEPVVAVGAFTHVDGSVRPGLIAVTASRIVVALDDSNEVVDPSSVEGAVAVDSADHISLELVANGVAVRFEQTGGATSSLVDSICGLRISSEAVQHEPPTGEENDTSGGEIGSAPHTGLAAEIRALADLHAEGLLTDEEFAAAKRQLISGGT